MSQDRKEVIIECGNDIAVSIVGLAPVSNDWLNQVKTYYKADLNSFSALIMLITAALLIELSLARVDDLLNKGELALLESTIFEKVVYFEDMLAGQAIDEEHMKNRKNYIGQTLTDIMKGAQEVRHKKQLTIPQSYLAVFFRPDYFKVKVPQEVLSEYMLGKINMAENENLRSKVADKV